MAKPSVDQLTEFHDQIRSGRVQGENLQRFLENPEWGSKKDGQKNQEPDPTLTSYSITIRHGDNFAKRMESLGCGKNINSSITEKNFPVAVSKAKGNEVLEVVLAHFNRYISSKKVIDILNKLGYRPGTFEEVVAFGADHPEIQRQFPIVALGTVVLVDGYRYVPYLSSYSSGRSLDLDWFDHDWSSDYRFLAVRMSA